MAQTKIDKFVINFIKKKIVTEKQISYVINKILMARIEYRIQITIFTKQECEKLFIQT